MRRPSPALGETAVHVHGTPLGQGLLPPRECSLLLAANRLPLLRAEGLVVSDDTPRLEKRVAGQCVRGHTHEEGGEGGART